jgi:hypothetical protein
MTLVLIATVTLLGEIGGGGFAGATAKVHAGGEPPGTRSAHRFAGTPTVGALFPPGETDHTCIAGVVASTAGNLGFRPSQKRTPWC